MGFRKTSISTNSATAIDQAENGLSVINPAPGDYRSVLGNDVGSTLARLTSNREIPLNNHDVYWSGPGHFTIGSTTANGDFAVDRFSSLAACSVNFLGTSTSVTVAAFAGSTLLTFISSVNTEIRIPYRNVSITQPSSVPLIGSYDWINFQNPNHNQNTGTINGIISQQAFRTTTGNAVMNFWNFNDTVDQTAGGTGITRGAYFNPIIFGTPADWRTIEIANNVGRAILASGSATNAFMGFSGFGQLIPTGRVHIGAGTTNIAPLFIDNGTLLTVMVNNAIENDGSFLWFTTAGVRSRLAMMATALGTDRVIFSSGGRITDNANFLFSSANNSVAIGGAATNLNCFFIIAAGTIAKAPARYSAGPVTTTIVNGNKEFDGTNEFVSAGGVRYTMAKTLTAVATLNFPAILTGAHQDLTIALTGAADGDVISLGIPSAAVTNGVSFFAFVSSPGVVTVRAYNYSLATQDPASADFRVSLTKYS